jgi:hypothetical protein
LFKQPEPVTVDPDNLSFKSKFKRKIEEYTQNWIVSDIRIDSKRTKEVNVDSEHNDDVDVANGDEKSKDQAIMLQEITPTILCIFFYFSLKFALETQIIRINGNWFRLFEQNKSQYIR